MSTVKPRSRYVEIIERIFLARWKPGDTSVPFTRPDIEQVAADLKLVLPKNIGDLLYSFRFRAALPQAVLDTADPGKEWVIEMKGRSLYEFRLVPLNRIVPNETYETIKIPDATPEVIRQYTQTDEQALLAIVRYNRLIDIFLSLTTYSLQNHLRTTVANRGQIEIDELYVGIDREGRHFVIPVQAKGGNDQLSVVQTKQDVECCAEKYPGLICLPISVQFMADDRIAMFLLKLEGDSILVREERHYQLVPGTEIDPRDWRP
ncbi:endonuclease [Luteimonas yindakuii]|uniref:endonuclease n=1 Tax=Luteimonas yindakuii TaxID=2565782 RepID=UPI0010A41AE3|nr:endonuclease [Luteimonas yindakuii]QCO66976.1 endonuclease [Luteimonas yindakuii]